jgi:hypothetical protein
MSANLLKTLSVGQLRRAITLRTQIARLEDQLSRLTGEASTAKPAGRRRRRFSAATRAKMAAAQKARWAKRKAGK